MSKTTSSAAHPRAAARTHRVLVFTTPSCPWCRRAKQYLREQRVPFREVDVSRDAAAALLAVLTAAEAKAA